MRRKSKDIDPIQAMYKNILEYLLFKSRYSDMSQFQMAHILKLSKQPKKVEDLAIGMGYMLKEFLNYRRKHIVPGPAPIDWIHNMVVFNSLVDEFAAIYGPLLNAEDMAARRELNKRWEQVMERYNAEALANRQRKQQAV